MEAGTTTAAKKTNRRVGFFAGACSGAARCKAEGGLARGAYWVVREHARPTDNAADGPSWTGSYLGKASLTPPSTGSTAPVVFDERLEAKNSTASATSDARILGCNKLRLA